MLGSAIIIYKKYKISWGHAPMKFYPWGPVPYASYTTDSETVMIIYMDTIGINSFEVLC